ncbi:hypothetical protein Lalb_Chr22g0359221 [Lupinus albus]|uniref:Uncharacterized protein n=1 Tax=Lupinus albus TaxID=3870 RepID=A0A6A4NIY0_LUPAL|nr:hypothetical protein Lalb_Chr22g0359221 [Lupinus albus]
MLSFFHFRQIGEIREESEKRWESENTREIVAIRLLRLHLSPFQCWRPPWFNHVLIPSSSRFLSYFFCLNWERDENPIPHLLPFSSAMVEGTTMEDVNTKIKGSCSKEDMESYGTTITQEPNRSQLETW